MTDPFHPWQAPRLMWSTAADNPVHLQARQAVEAGWGRVDQALAAVSSFGLVAPLDDSRAPPEPSSRGLRGTYLAMQARDGAEAVLRALRLPPITPADRIDVGHVMGRLMWAVGVAEERANDSHAWREAVGRVGTTAAAVAWLDFGAAVAQGLAQAVEEGLHDAVATAAPMHARAKWALLVRVLPPVAHFRDALAEKAVRCATRHGARRTALAEGVLALTTALERAVLLPARVPMTRPMAMGAPWAEMPTTTRTALDRIVLAAVPARAGTAGRHGRLL